MPQRKFQVDRNEYPFESHWFEKDGANMHYVDEGEGTPVVMCHGNPTWSFLYRNIIKALAGECRCISYDLPGFGFSDHPTGYGYTPQEHSRWVTALVNDHLQLEKYIIVVQDWGGPIGLNMATRNPEKVLGAVISSTFAWKPLAIGKIFSNLLGNTFGKKMILKHNLFAGTLVPTILGKQTDPAVLDAYTAPFPTPESRMGTAVFPEQITGATPWLIELEQRLHTLKDKPVEFVFGLKDLGTRPKDRAKWLSHFPDAGVQEFPKANHFTQEDVPEAYVTAIRRILNKIQ